MSVSPRARVGVLFVCYANMCRSPLAEGVFRHLAEQGGKLDRLDIDSAGTDAIEGCEPHPLSCDVARVHGVTLSGRGRQLVRDDLGRFDHVVVMDRQNFKRIASLVAPSGGGKIEGYRAQVRTLRSFSNPHASGRELDVPDPIGGGPEHYARTYELIVTGCKALLDEIV